MKFVRIAIISLLLVILAGFFAGNFAWNQLNERIEVDSTKLVKIPMGSATGQILDTLVAEEVLKDKLPLQIYIKLTGAGARVKAGDYYFPSPISPIGVLQKLEEGGQGAGKITVVEGWNRWDIAEAMVHIPTLKLKDSKSALALMDDPASIKDLDPSATSLEGYLFPDTYFVYSDTSAKDLIAAIVKQFRTIWQGKLADEAKSRKQSIHDIVTIASIIETEAKLPEERPIVASVIYNRLKQKMYLSVDSTIVYAAKQAGKWKNDGKVYQSDIDRNSPYNTRKHLGLPPGPVGCPGLPSMQAALEPANTTFLYYVRNPARNDGAHNFYSDPASFEIGVKALRDWELKHKAKQR